MINFKTPFGIYCRAIGLYAILTLPAAVIPEMYLISLFYVLVYGWFAWFLFTLLYVVADNLLFDFVPKFLVLFTAVIVAVAFAYQMIGMLLMHENVWHSGFIVFPFAAVIAGWISVCISREKIRSSCYVQEGSNSSN